VTAPLFGQVAYELERLRKLADPQLSLPVSNDRPGTSLRGAPGPAVDNKGA
jgi:hypothetical protein